jgi:hypothetical protein
MQDPETLYQISRALPGYEEVRCSTGGSVEFRSHMQQSDAMGRVDTNILDQVGGCESYSVIGPLGFQLSMGCFVCEVSRYS